MVQIVLDGARKAGDCKQEGSLLFSELHLFRFPPGWRVAIVCTPVRWEQILQQRDLDYRTRAFTNLESRLTVLNGDIFREFPSNYRHIIAHELGHVRCQCKEEDRADQIADRLESEAKQAESTPRLASETPKSVGGSK